MKTYTIPTLVTNGAVVRETLVGALKGAPESPTRKPISLGDVGFYL